MGKTYTICVGTEEGRSTAEKCLLEIIEKYRSHNHVLVDEALKMEPDLDTYNLAEAAKLYDPANEGHTFHTIQLIEDKVENQWLVILHTIGNEPDGSKEALCRAFCRLVIKDMHLKKHEVNITVS